VIIDTSAVRAILLKETDAPIYAQAIASADICRMSAATFVELGIVVDLETKSTGGRLLDTLMRRSQIVIEPVTEEQAHIARHAYAEFGKGIHPASLNFGDCFAYALAKATGEPLLFKGEDFAKTDISSAL
jgi:ribonuclease VapC